MAVSASRCRPTSALPKCVGSHNFGILHFAELAGVIHTLKQGRRKQPMRERRADSQCITSVTTMMWLYTSLTLKFAPYR